MEQFELDLINFNPDPPFDNELSTLISPFTLGLICHMFESVRFLSNIIRSLSQGIVDVSISNTLNSSGGDMENSSEKLSEITNFRKKQEKVSNSSVVQRRLSLRSRLLPTLSQMKFFEGISTSRPNSPPGSPKGNGGNGDEKTQYTEILEIAKPHLLKLNRIADRYDNVSYRLLFTLKVEMRVVCYAHILGILKSSYSFDVEPDQIIEADGFLHELHSNLLAIDQVFTASLTNAVRLYIYDGLQDLLPTILIKGL